MYGLPLPQRPGQDDLEITGPLDEQHAADLTQLMYHLASWSAYACHMLAQASIDLYRSEQDLEAAFAKVFMVPGLSKESVADKKARAEASPTVKAVKNELAEAKEKVLLIKAVIDGYDKKYNAISRELSRRSSVINNTGF